MEVQAESLYEAAVLAFRAFKKARDRCEPPSRRLDAYCFAGPYRALEYESNRYKDVAGARGSFDWKIGGGKASGEWFLVAADVNPW